MECSICLKDFQEEAEKTTPSSSSASKSNTRPILHDNDQDDPGDETVCALRCGHVYHRGCIKTWFQQYLIANFGCADETDSLSDQLYGPCPICKVCTMLFLSTQLFPTFKEKGREEKPGEEMEREGAQEELNNLRRANAEREGKIEELTNKLKEIRMENCKQRSRIVLLKAAIQTKEEKAGPASRVRSGSKVFMPVNK